METIDWSIKDLMVVWKSFWVFMINVEVGDTELRLKKLFNTPWYSIQNYDVARVELSIYSAEYLSLELIKSKELLYTLPSNNTWKALGSGDDRC